MFYMRHTDQLYIVADKEEILCTFAFGQSNAISETTSDERIVHIAGCYIARLVSWASVIKYFDVITSVRPTEGLVESVRFATTAVFKNDRYGFVRAHRAAGPLRSLDDLKPKETSRSCLQGVPCDLDTIHNWLRHCFQTLLNPKIILPLVRVRWSRSAV